jgi:diacylglycerol kinase family enzyme
VSRSLVIINPSASRLRDEAARRSLKQQVGVVMSRRDGLAPEIVETTDGSESQSLVEAALAGGAPSVVGAGGDGTLRGLASFLVGRGVPMGIVPGGTGNQVAAVLGIPSSPTEAIAALEHARRRDLDIGEARLRQESGEVESIFILGCGAGLDARLMATTSHASKRRYGKTAYFAQGVRLAMRVDASPVRISLDGEIIETEASLALVGNMGHLVPGVVGLRLPLDPEDGLLDLIVVAARGPIHGLKGLFDQLTRTALGGTSGSDSLRLRGRHISVEFHSPAPMQVDGDYVGEGSLEARVRPGALEVLVPAGA